MIQILNQADMLHADKKKKPDPLQQYTTILR